MAHKYFSQFISQALKEGLKGPSEGDSERVKQLEAEKNALESDLTSAKEKIQELNAVVENKYLELGTSRSQLEINSEATVRLEGLVRELEEKLKSDKEEMKLFAGSQFKQSRFEGLHVGESLGYEKGYQAAYAAFSRSRGMQNLVEGYRQKIFQRIWHSMLFIQKASPLA